MLEEPTSHPDLAGRAAFRAGSTPTRAPGREPHPASGVRLFWSDLRGHEPQLANVPCLAVLARRRSLRAPRNR